MTESVIQAARVHWALGDAPITLVAARENRVYRVDGPNRTAALRLHRQGYRSTDEIHAELLWMDMLADNGVPVPEPVQAPDGTTIQSFDCVVVDLLSWVDGTPLSKTDVTEQHYFKLGCLVAQMHNLADAWDCPAEFNRPTWDLVGEQPSWGRFWENPLLSRQQRVRFSAFRNTARQAIETMQQPDCGLIHADLVPDNVLSHGDQLHVIDFDDGGFGYRLFDLATITHRSRRRYGNDALAEATVAGYCTKRDLNLQALPLFEAMRACSYVGWSISRMSEPNGHSRNARFIAEAENAMDLWC